jgi:hypothetical protein
VGVVGDDGGRADGRRPARRQSLPGHRCVGQRAEQTLFEAAGRQGDSSRAPPKCEFRDIKRDAANSSWQATCEGPMGKMQGSGGGTLGAESADLQQTFNVKAPIGSMTVKQTLRARRVGSC